MTGILLADCETTSADPDTTEIIEAAWLELPDDIDSFLAVRNTQKFPFYHQRFQPTQSIQLGAMATHNIIPSDLEGCAKSELFELPDDVFFLIGQNIDFDAKCMGVYELDLPAIRRICTLALSRWLFPEVDSHKQVAMIYHIGHQIGDLAWARDLTSKAHAALDDVRVCAVLLRFLIGEMRKRGYVVDSWDELHELSEQARIPKVMSFGKHKGDLISDVPSSYAQWYSRQDETDHYVIKAFKKAGKI